MSVTVWLMSSVTRSPALTEGVTPSMTPVSLYWMLVVMMLLVVLLLLSTAPVLMGCWVPTWMAAVWLSSTMSEGLDMTLSSDWLASAVSTALMLPAELRRV